MNKLLGKNPILPPDLEKPSTIYFVHGIVTIDLVGWIFEKCSINWLLKTIVEINSETK